MQCSVPPASTRGGCGSHGQAAVAGSVRGVVEVWADLTEVTCVQEDTAKWRCSLTTTYNGNHGSREIGRKLDVKIVAGASVGSIRLA
jgi:hypothetical protein